MGWLAEHLEQFVKPVLGYIPEAKPWSVPYFTAEELCLIKNTWKSVKRQANHKPILLPGRDVYVFEILARRENYPTLFLPEISRVVAPVMTDLSEYHLFDTGFAGSVPRALKSTRYSMVSSNTNRFSRQDSVQVFPHLTGSRQLALKIERTPKYWETGRLVDEKVVQTLSGFTEFLGAAVLTIEVYKNSATKFVEQVTKRRKYGYYSY